LGALKDLQSQGKIRHIGLSEVGPKEIKNAGKSVRIVTVQNLYNLTDRSHEPALKYCEENEIGFIPWFPVAAGKLTKPGGPLDELAQRHGISVAQLSIAWLLHLSKVMMPIPGTSSVAHLEENVAASAISLSDRDWAEVHSRVP
jgi:aryl-alcohol dehydrogenase-like predicted oxidoreductase